MSRANRFALPAFVLLSAALLATGAHADFGPPQGALTAEADTLATVTARGATSSADLSLTGTLTIVPGTLIVDTAGADSIYTAADVNGWKLVATSTDIILLSMDPSTGDVTIPSPVLGDGALIGIGSGAYFSWDSDTDFLGYKPGDGTFQCVTNETLHLQGDTGITLSAGVTTVTGVLDVATYTAATLPAATTAGRIIYVSDGAAGLPILAFSDGSNWLRVDTRAAVSGS